MLRTIISQFELRIIHTQVLTNIYLFGGSIINSCDQQKADS